MLGNLIIGNRFLLIGALLILTSYSLHLIPKIQVDQNYDHYFPGNDPALKFYEYLTSELSNEDDFLAVAIENPTGVLEKSFLETFHRFVLTCDTLSYIAHVWSLTNLEEPVKTPFGLIFRPFLHPAQTLAYHSDSLRISNDPRLIERFISKDFTALSIILEIEKDLNARQAERLVKGIENQISHFNFAQVHIAGRKYFEVSYNRLANSELKKSIIFCLLFMILVLTWLYRSFWGVLVPISIFLLTVINFLGYLAFIDHALDAMSNLFPTIILIVSIADAIYLINKYEDLIRGGSEKHLALRMAINEMGLVTFLTSITTITGFLTFFFSPIPSINRFGLDVAIAVLLAYIITMTVVPFLLFYCKPKAFRIIPSMIMSWNIFAARSFDFVQKKSKFILVSALCLLGLSILGLLSINTNNKLVSSMPKNHPMRTAFDSFDRQLGGVRTFEIAILPQVSSQINNLPILSEIEKVHDYIDSFPETAPRRRNFNRNPRSQISSTANRSARPITKA